MNDLLVKKFKGEDFYNLVLDDRPCWVGVDLTEKLGYIDKSSPISACIAKENLLEEIHYEVLKGEKLKVFKETFGDYLTHIKKSPKLVIFYEEGLYRFLLWSRKTKGLELRAWVSEEVLPSLRKRGYYTVSNEEVEVSKIENLTSEVNNIEFDDLKLQRIKYAYESARMLKDVLDDITKDSTYKYLVLKQVFVDSGINIPPYIDEELH